LTQAPGPQKFSRYSGRTQLLVQQALHEQERIGWDKAFRGYSNLTWVYNKTPQPDPNLERAARPCGQTATRKSMFQLTPPRQHPILMRTLSTTMPTLQIFSQLIVSFFTALPCRSSVLDKRPKQNGSTAYATPIHAFLKIAPVGNTPFATSSTDQFLLPTSSLRTLAHHICI